MVGEYELGFFLFICCYLLYECLNLYEIDMIVDQLNMKDQNQSSMQIKIDPLRIQGFLNCTAAS